MLIFRGRAAALRAFRAILANDLALPCAPVLGSVCSLAHFARDGAQERSMIHQQHAGMPKIAQRCVHPGLGGIAADCSPLMRDSMAEGRGGRLDSLPLMRDSIAGGWGCRLGSHGRRMGTSAGGGEEKGKDERGGDGAKDGDKGEAKEGEGAKGRGDTVEKLLRMGVAYTTAAEEGLRRRADQLKSLLQQAVQGPEDSGRTPQKSNTSDALLEGGGIFGSVLRLLLTILSYSLSRAVASIADTTFNEEQFLEGSKDAYFMVTHLFGERDWVTLKPLVSERLFNVMQGVAADYEKQGLKYTTTAEDVRSAFVTAFSLLDLEAVRKFYPSGLEAPPDHLWLMVGVRFLSLDRSVVTRPDGVVISDDRQLREDQWTFVKGPLAKVPAGKSDLQWTLLSIG
ncbi:unnamed protein product [Ostreobium quekettii]|uniref:Tim44-like domain-containing protein n=1 Tax=Ostreobium quekettii TaxID=121088 RepID=A0A8S1JB92_9CHLO|nr:unnamed protein product [Ostreobium quekettii]